MSSVNRVLKKRREAQGTGNQYQQNTTPNGPVAGSSSQAVQKSLFNQQLQTKLQGYTGYADYNPSNIQFFNTYIPATLRVHNSCRVPLSCFISPINEDLQYMQKSAGGIPRCFQCKAYMNYYNEVSNKQFKCFICGNQNSYQIQYNPKEEGIQLRQPSYMVDGPTGIYPGVPPESVYIYLVDISKEAFACRMLSYFVSVMKEVLAREELNDTQIYFYTYDETVHQYDFTGPEVQCNILDPSIKNSTCRNPDCTLSNIRDKLFVFLDSLEEIAEKNPKQGSNFMSVMEYVYENIKQTGGKIFIFQANEAIIGQNFTSENIKKVPGLQQVPNIKSVVQTKNKLFFIRFLQNMLQDNISMSLFIFGRAYKNIRVFADPCKLTNSQLMYYNKENPEQALKFYYDLYAIMGANYYIDVRVEFVISLGWYFTAVYGNVYRMKESIIFKLNHYENSKKICANFLPQQSATPPLPYFSMQVITNYIYGRKHYLQVNTAVLPLTTSLDRLFQNMNLQMMTASIVKSYLSSIRLQEITSCKNKFIKHISSIWKAVNDYYKGNLPPEWKNVFLSFLGFLKNNQTQPDLILDSISFDRLISYRNVLQSCNYPQVITNFSPYLFDLSTVGTDRCLEDNFIYPDVCELRFSSIKEGVFLMDAGQSLYLYFAKTYHPNYSLSLFGKQKIVKGDILSQQQLSLNDNLFSQQVQNLLRILRENKIYKWAPLYIFRCGQNTIHQKEFYLKFYEQKYDEFRSYKITYEEFTSMLAKQF